MSNNQPSYPESSTSSSSYSGVAVKREGYNPSDSIINTAGLKQSEGGPTPRSYLDSTVVPTLLEGLKLLATERPSDPLAYLGRFLLSRSNERQ
ncbi:unnamed protein product [Mucor hiemalis]